MTKKYKHAGIAGKFRLLHQAHVELIIRAQLLTENLHIFIVDVPDYIRYSSIEQLLQAFQTILTDLNCQNFKLHLITEELSGVAWDQKVLELVPDIEVMFDSKEAYNNLLIENQFLVLDSENDISVSAIEEDIYQYINFQYIDKTFQQLLCQKVTIVDENDAKAEKHARQLAKYYQSAYGNFYEHDRLIFMSATLSEIDIIDTDTTYIFLQAEPGDKKNNIYLNEALTDVEQFEQSITIIQHHVFKNRRK